MSSSLLRLYSPESNGSNREDGNDGRDSRLSALDAPSFVLLPPHALLQAAVSLKDQVVDVTWTARGGGAGPNVDPTVYTGLLGTAYTCLRSFEATGSRRDLNLCADIVDACASASRASTTRHITFLCGRGGIYALGAVAANYCGDQQKQELYLNCFLEVAQEKALPVGPEEGGFGMSYDLLYGRAGFLWAALFIKRHLGCEAVPDELLMPVVEAILEGGRAGSADNSVCPLMYRWHGTRYWGAAHGLAGILQVLLHFPLSDDGIEDVKGTLRYMMNNRFPHTGNYPVSEGNPRDKLVQWSHGATGVCITLCRASQVFPEDREFRNAAIEAGEVVWKNGLVKKAGLADGAAGNAYAFLSLYRLTGESIYKERAVAFASFVHHHGGRDHTAYGADHAYSLFRGLAGAVCLWFDLMSPENSRFPCYEI